jgi:hypothetical protein
MRQCVCSVGSSLPPWPGSRSAAPRVQVTPALPAASLPSDPHTSSALLKIATAFNHDYDIGDYGPVYARWYARSQAIISRAEYIRRHRDCPGGQQALSRTERSARVRMGRGWCITRSAASS